MFCVPLGSKAVTMTSAALIVVDIGLVAVPMPSLTFTVKLAAPGDVGVPEITPLALSSESPADRVPSVIDQV